jgi:hypothetical protein
MPHTKVKWFAGRRLKIGNISVSYLVYEAVIIIAVIKAGIITLSINIY